ncbi:MocR-like pyridoxine biosynthesis transcription factor PdxR [Steroidobacter agaridevorans]
MPDLRIELDRGRAMPLATQIYEAIRDAIESGHLTSGAKLPSWQDLASQLGVSRGTVRGAYERLMDEQFAIGRGAAGTRVAERPRTSSTPGRPAEATPVAELFHDFGTVPLTFQMGVPSQAAFPFKLWSRVLTRASRAAAAAPVSYPDPRGEPELRKEIAGYLAIARGLHCKPSQILITTGFSGALGLALRTLQLEGKQAWMEDPGFPLTRTALRLAGVSVTGVPVDAEGLDVTAGVRSAPEAALAIVTPGQHAPLGMTMSLPRRLALLEWAGRCGAWIIEDDYLSELQLHGRAAPALASLDTQERVLHIGTFSKTISPALRLGFLVVPSPLVNRFADVAASLAPAPPATVQRAVAAFMREGHYLRHLRRMKRLYRTQRESLLRCLRELSSNAVTVQASAGLAIVTLLPRSLSDIDVALRALPFGLAPTPLSPWSIQTPASRGLLLGVTNLDERRLAADCRRLIDLAEQAQR